MAGQTAAAVAVVVDAGLALAALVGVGIPVVADLFVHIAAAEEIRYTAVEGAPDADIQFAEVVESQWAARS